MLLMLRYLKLNNIGVEVNAHEHDQRTVIVDLPVPQFQKEFVEGVSLQDLRWLL